MMSTLDWMFVAVVLASLLLGAWRGLVYEVLSLLGWVVGFVVARSWAQEVAVWLPLDGWDMQLRYAAGFVLLLVGSMFAWGVISWLSKQLIEAVGLRPVDRTLGALFGVLRGGLLLLVLALVIQYTPLHKALWWQDSALAPWLSEVLGWALPALPQEWGQYLPKASS
ncbi:colicin V synthesis protein [Comamonas testosteroni TK102]|uniref:Colicin V synthesis protein n=2 Tax=Comamonas testosteroni TaxID=285 RepID=A0A076PQC1_COMTE|nr:colicin V synthesis protein [Comamonas testosteroni TK102]